MQTTIEPTRKDLILSVFGVLWVVAALAVGPAFCPPVMPTAFVGILMADFKESIKNDSMRRVPLAALAFFATAALFNTKWPLWPTLVLMALRTYQLLNPSPKGGAEIST